MVDYDKWSQFDLSDDEDGVEVPRNVEHQTYMRLLREKRRRDRAAAAEEAAARLERVKTLRAALDAPGAASAAAADNADRVAMLNELRDLEAEIARGAARPKLTYENMLVEGFDVTSINSDPPAATSTAADDTAAGAATAAAGAGAAAPNGDAASGPSSSTPPGAAAGGAKAGAGAKAKPPLPAVPAREVSPEDLAKLVEQFSNRASFAATSSFLRNNADILLFDQTALPMLARMASQAMFQNDETRARQCIQQLLLLQTCQSVGPGPGIDIFFHGLQRNDLGQRDHFHQDVDDRMKELQGHVIGFHTRQADRAAAAAKAAAEAAAVSGASSSSTTADAVDNEPMEAISTARQRALDELPADFRRALEEGNLAMVNGYLGISPLQQVERVLRTCVEGGLVTFGASQKIEAIHTKGSMISAEAQAQSERICEELLLKMRTLQAMPPAVRTALKTNQMTQVVAALRVLPAFEAEEMLNSVIASKIIVATNPVLEALRDVVGRRPANPDKDGETISLRQQLLFACLPASLQEALRNQDLEGFKRGLNELPIPEAQALLAECQSVGLVERAGRLPGSAGRADAQTHSASSVSEHVYLVGGLLALLAAIYVGVYWLPSDVTSWGVVLRAVLRYLSGFAS